jgi:hypothetical protein
LGAETDSEMPSNVQELMRTRVHSVDRLLVLLLLVQTEPSRTWRAAEIADSLRMNEDLVLSVLDKLVADRFCRREPSGGIRFGPESPELADDVAALADFYRDHAGDVLVFMSQMAISRVRNSALLTFSEAFRFNRSKKDDDG